jgi:hypothetical protein
VGLWRPCEDAQTPQSLPPQAVDTLRHVACAACTYVAWTHEKTRGRWQYCELFGPILACVELRHVGLIPCTTYHGAHVAARTQVFGVSVMKVPPV